MRGVRRSATWLGYKRSTQQHVSYVLYANKRIQVKSCAVKLSKLAHKKVRITDPNTTALTKRAYRYRRPVRVIGVQFQYGKTIGDFHQMLQEPSIKHNMVALFNDNHEQWVLADPNKASFYDNPGAHSRGGGNAIVRPYQRSYHAIGMPTGPYNSLDDKYEVHGEILTVAQIIHAATVRVCQLFVNHPEKEVLYYSATSSGEIGLGIFAGLVGFDVREYTTACIKAIPLLTEELRKTGKCVSFPVQHPWNPGCDW